jgi:hypothetical protein
VTGVCPCHVFVPDAGDAMQHEARVHGRGLH